MSTSVLFRATRNGSFALILTGLLAIGNPVNANAQNPDHQRQDHQSGAKPPAQATPPPSRPAPPVQTPRPAQQQAAPVLRPAPSFSRPEPTMTRPTTPTPSPVITPSQPASNPGGNFGGRSGFGQTNPGGTRTPTAPATGTGTRDTTTPPSGFGSGRNTNLPTNNPGNNNFGGRNNQIPVNVPGNNPGGQNTNLPTNNPGNNNFGGRNNQIPVNGAGSNDGGVTHTTTPVNVPGNNPGGRNTNLPTNNPSNNNFGGRNSNSPANTPGYNNPGNNNFGGRNNGVPPNGNGNTPGYNNGGRNQGTTPNGFGAGNYNGGRNTNNGGDWGGGRSFGSHNQGIHTMPSKGSREDSTRDGSGIRVRPNGRVSDVHDVRRGIDVHQGLNGGRRIWETRPDHSSAVFERGRPGYVQRPYSYRGHDFDRRTYVYQGHTYDNFFRGFRFHGLDIHVYAPSRYYDRGYYGWAYNPWNRPIRYRWGWMSNPWYGYYGYYFRPYNEYPSASLWLTDYLISTDLQAAYNAHLEAGEMNGDPGSNVAPLTPEVKQLIADEVRDQLALETQEAQQNAQQQYADPGSSGIARMLNDAANGHPHVLLVGSALDVVDRSGIECSLSDGDALRLEYAPAPDAITADLVVLSSKGGQECPRSDTVSVSLDDLQEMQNHMRANIDLGLQELQANQGRGGLPTAPYSGQASAAIYTASAPPPDQNAATWLQQEGQQADQAVNEVSADVSHQSGSPAASPTISAGQSIGEVESILGQPTSKANLGNKIIYNYNGMKVIFMNGRVSDVQ